jgi:hypothetical protein
LHFPIGRILLDAWFTLASSATNRRQTGPATLLSERNVRAFGQAFRDRLNSQDGSLRKAYIRELVDKVEVGRKEIRISGSEATLATSVIAATNRGDASVPSFAKGWWAHKDSNLGPAD